MLGLNKKMINNAFRAFITKISCCHGIPINKMSLVIRIQEKGILIQLCQKDVPRTTVDLGTMLTEEMIGLRFDVHTVEKFFRVVHHAYMKQMKQTDPLKISLVLYESGVALCACLGVLQNEKTIKVHLVAELLQAIELGSEQLN